MTGHVEHDRIGEGKVAVAIRRDKDPVTEWDWNSELIAGAFPCLFTRGGKALPTVRDRGINQTPHA
ncbi:hypothetical protein GQ600_12565 [Phytophthora cactorum]|nr:hypothetical protein GQ600_12565 [Phytophthora cactorum]